MPEAIEWQEALAPNVRLVTYPPPTIAAMERSLAPDHWRALSPLLSCTDEAEFRHHINALTEALSQLPRGSLIRFQMGLLKSIPLDVRKPLTELLGSYGLRIH